MKRAQLLAALESVRAWARELPDDVEPFRLQPIPGLVVIVREGPSSNALKCERYRKSRKGVSTRVAPQTDTVSRPVSDTVPTGVATRVEPVSRPVSHLPIPSVPPGPPSDSLSPSLPKAAAAISEGSDRLPAREPDSSAEPRDWAKQPPRNLDEAREMPLEPRARRVLDNPHDAQWIQPEQWAEVRMAVVAYREAVKQPRLRVGRFNDDAGVRRLVELFAAGLTAEEVCAIVPAVVASPWWRDGSPKDLGSLTLTVARRALAERPASADLDALPRQMFGGGA